jgi:mannosyltransferase
LGVRIAVMGDDAAVARHADLAMRIRRVAGGARLSLGSYETTIELIGIMILAMLLRVLFLGKESLWWDEAESVRIAGASWRGLADILWNGQANMGFYYGLLHVWLGLGRSEFALRALSVVIAVMTVPACYLLGARLFGRRAGFLAALLIAINVYHLRYSQEARSYALVVLLVTLASLFFVSAVRRPSWTAWGLYTGAIVLGVYSHFFVVFVLIAHWISLAFLPRRVVPWRSVMISAGAIGMLLLPIVVFAVMKDRGQIDWISHAPPDFVARAFTYLAGGSSASGIPVADRLFRVSELGRRVLWLLYAAFVAVALANGGRLWLRSRISPETWDYGFLVAWLVVPPILAYLISLIKPMFIFYYLIVSLPPLVVLAADGLSRIRSTVMYAAALIVFASITGLQVVAYYNFGGKEDWRGLTGYVLAHAQPGDGLIFSTGSRAAFEYYRERFHRTPSAPPLILSRVDVARDHPRRLWLVIAHSGESDTSRAHSALAGRYTLVEDTPFYDGLHALLYASVGVR